MREILCNAIHFVCGGFIHCVFKQGDCNSRRYNLSVSNHVLDEFAILRVKEVIKTTRLPLNWRPPFLHAGDHLRKGGHIQTFQPVCDIE